MEDKFLLPGRDGEFDPSVNIWRKGVVFTRRAPGVMPGCRVSVAFKRSVSSLQPLISLHDLYERVTELIAADPSWEAVIVCHGWRFLGDAGNVAAAFITLALRSTLVPGGT